MALAGLLFTWGCMPSSNPYSAPNLLGNGTPTATPLPGSPTLTPIPTNTFSSLFTATHTLTPVFSPTHTFTAVDTATPTTQATLTPTQSMTPTQTNTATNTMTNSDTPTSSFTAVNTNTWTITDTPLPTNTATPTATPTVTSTSTTTSTATPTCAGAGGTYQSASALNGAWGDVNVIDCRPITVVGLIKVTEFVLTGYNAASVPITENIGIYSDSGGYPATLIAAGSGPVTAGALTPIIAFGSPVPLTTGVYWLAADSDNNIGGQVVLPGFGISLNMNYTDGGVSGTDPTGNPIAMPGTLGGAVNQYEPCIAAEWVCP